MVHPLEVTFCSMNWHVRCKSGSRTHENIHSTPMITRLLLSLVLVAAICASAVATSEDIVQRHLSVSTGGKLVVDVDFGTVDITAGADNEVVVDARRLVDVANQEEEKEFIAAAPITVSQEGGTITVRSRSNRQWHWSRPNIHMDAHYAVQVPRNFNADLRTGGGSVAVTQLNGELKANTSGGSLNFKRVRGPVDGHTNGGDVKLADCDGAIKVRTNGGHIDSVGGNGSLNAQTNGGLVSIRNFAGQVDTSTNGGRMDLRDIGGPLTARTSGGGINATMTNTTDVSLETSAGAINLAIPPSGGFRIDAQASTGRVTTDLPLAVEHKHNDKLVGDLNGGGKSLYLRTAAGSISITAAPRDTAGLSSQ